MASDYPEYMNSREAEVYSGLKSLAKRRILGTSPPYIKTSAGKNSRVLYSRKAIDEWLQARMRTSTSNHTVAALAAARA